MKKTIGIIGGMGPMATADLFRKMISMTKASTDQEHLHIIVDDIPTIPDRLASIAGKGPDALPEMVRSALRLETAGAEVLVMACNTAHIYYDKILPFVKVQFLNILEEAAKEAKRRGYQKLGLFGTTPTLELKLYDKVLERYGIETIHPCEESQGYVTYIIRECVKAGQMERIDRERFLGIVGEMEAKGAQAMLLGCTEIPMAFEAAKIETACIDPTSVIAARAILAAGGKLKD